MWAVVDAEREIGDSVLDPSGSVTWNGVQVVGILSLGAQEMSVATLQGEAVGQSREAIDDVDNRPVDGARIQYR